LIHPNKQADIYLTSHFFKISVGLLSTFRPTAGLLSGEQESSKCFSSAWAHCISILHWA